MSTEMKILRGRGAWACSTETDSSATIESRANIDRHSTRPRSPARPTAAELRSVGRVAAFGPYRASWKITPSVIRSPAVTVLTPWRIVTR